MQKSKFLEKLLDGEEVEWERLGAGKNSVSILSRGRVMSRAYLAKNAGEYPVYSSQTINSGEIGKIKTFDFDGEAVTWTTDGANAGTVFYRNGKFSITNVCGIIKINNTKKLNYKYLYYWLSIEARKHVYFGMGNPKLMSNQMAKILIPIPPLHVQSKIVQILDNFTELTAELTAELSLRKKQYNYYLNKLLNFSDDTIVEGYKYLSEVVVATKNIQWHKTDKTYLYIDLTSVCRENNSIIETTKISSENAPSRAKKLVNKSDVIFATTRPTQMRLTIIDDYYDGSIASTGYCVLRAKKEEVLPKWIYFNITTKKFKNYLEQNQSGTAYPAISDAKLKNYKIPIPPLKEQKKIVAILDKFDTLINSISEGLPHEVELRKKQYEYYRDLLLNFPKTKEVV